MKVTKIYVYPIKALRGIPLQTARLGPQGIEVAAGTPCDRRFMLYRVAKDGKLKKMQLSEHPECSLFEQKFVDADIVVRYVVPEQPLRPSEELPTELTLSVPLEPDISQLEKIHVDLHGSAASVYRMGQDFDSWFSACFGFECIFVYIGDGKRPVLGSTLPPKVPQSQVSSWLPKFITGATSQQQNNAWLTFTDVAPFMVATEASLRNVSGRMSDGQPVDMCKFRPNIVVEGEGEWDEDFWAELTFDGANKLLLTGNCGRCTSLNVDYDTGRPAAGEAGTVLKKLMKDRRVDKGVKYSPIFGRYGFLPVDGSAFEVSVGDEVDVTKRLEERSTWDWPGL